MAAEQIILPISELTSYQTRWTIRARVTSKAPLRTFSKGTGQGKVFHVELLDAQGGEIRASFFNEAVDMYYEKLTVGRCYTFSKGNVRVANRQYNACNHRYELSFDKICQVEDAEDDAGIETMKFSFTDLRTLQSKNLPCKVDLCGVLTSFGQVLSFTSKEGRQLVKREITIADDTATSIGVTLWADKAKQDESLYAEGVPISLKGVMVKEWNGGRSGSLSEGGTLVFGPVNQEAQKAQQWWAQGGSKQALAALSQTLAAGGGGGARLANAKSVDLGELRKAAERVTEQPETFNVVCRLALVQMRKQGEVQPLYYMACMEPKEGNGLPCNRRVDSSGFCPSCNRAGKVAARLNIRCRFSDFGDSAWLTTFHEAAQKALGMTAQEVQALEGGEGGRDALEAVVRSKYFGEPLQVSVRAKLETYNGETRANIACVDARPVPRAEHGRVLLREIRDMIATSTVGGA